MKVKERHISQLWNLHFGVEEQMEIHNQKYNNGQLKAELVGLVGNEACFELNKYRW